MFRVLRGVTRRLYRHRYKIAWSVLLVSVLISIFVRSPAGFFDEQVHYTRAQGIANGQLLGYSKDGDMSKVGHDVSRLDDEYMYQYYQGSRPDPVSTKWITSPVITSGIADDSVYVINTSAAPYTPAPYFSYAMGIKFAQLFGANSKVEFIIMRIFGAVLSLLIIYLAFRVSTKKY